ncbi:MAG TPA: calcium-binding protein [Casimicrobiaceae bacterium]|nr:calcium-binding protein [Casimicrobiaceae bacterium]
MAESDFSTFEVNPHPSPRPFAVASWLGMSPDEVLAGLADGSIARPPGAAPDWRPPGLPGASGFAPTIALPSSAAGDGSDPIPQLPPDLLQPDGTVGIVPGRAEVLGWFQALDPDFSANSFESIWRRAGESESARAASLTRYLARTLLAVNAPEGNPADRSNALSLARLSDQLTAFTAEPSNRAHVVDLVGMDGAALAERARTDVGYRYALAQLDSIALTGNRGLFAAANSDSAIDRFDPDTGETQLSDAWLGDRAKFLAWKMASDGGNDLTIGGNQSWTFVDRTRVGSDGQPFSLKLTPEKGDDVQNQVIFGAEGAESIRGKAGTDRIYGGDGDDMLRGAGGADHLEGGHGDDTLLGGSGSDELVGNQGDDDLDGGRGSDALDGGSGDDTLVGGRGDDALAGGVGADTYVIDAGDGTDTISDSDGQGSISLDDGVLTGATRSQNRTWTSADGRFDYTLEGSLAGEGTLEIRAFAPGADHMGNPDNVIHVDHWHNGDLGITLSTDPSASGLDSTPIVDSPDPEIYTPSDVVPADPLALAALDNASPGSDVGQAPAAETPLVDELAPAPAPEVIDAFQQIFGPSTSEAPTVGPLQLQQAVAAFAGVPVPPDISPLGLSGSHAAVDGVSIADIAGALAADAAADDFSHEFASAIMQITPDWHRIDEARMPSGGDPRGIGIGELVARK